MFIPHEPFNICNVMCTVLKTPKLNAGHSPQPLCAPPHTKREIATDKLKVMMCKELSRLVPDTDRR